MENWMYISADQRTSCTLLMHVIAFSEQLGMWCSGQVLHWLLMDKWLRQTNAVMDNDKCFWLYLMIQEHLFWTGWHELYFEERWKLTLCQSLPKFIWSTSAW